MEISVIGISHFTAPVEVREKAALPGDLSRQLLRVFHAEHAFEEALILDTCNRTELYFVPRDKQDPLAYILGRIARLKGAAEVPDASLFYRRDGKDAVRHLFRVAAALDSQIVGENEILGQVKNAYRMALEERTARFLLNKVMHLAFRVGKRVRTETELGRGSTSVAQAAAELAGQVFTNLSDKTVLLVGAGQTAESAARRLVQTGIRQVIVANRTLSRAQGLADELARGADSPAAEEDGGRERIACPALLRLSGMDGGTEAGRSAPPPAHPPTRAIELSDIPKVIAGVDLVICSTGSPDLVLSYEELADAIRRRKGLLLMVDIAVPRDVDPRLGDLPNVFLHNINDLDQVVARNLERRRGEIPKAEAIVEYELDRLVQWRDSLEMTTIIKRLRKRFNLLHHEQVERYAKQFDDTDQEQLKLFTQNLCNKLLHRPTSFLRRLSQEATLGERLLAADTLRRMFDLDELGDEE